MIKKILIINPFGIGDVLFTTPVLANLRLAYPQAKITYLANRRTAEFLEHHSCIDQVFTYERDEFVGVWKKNPIEFFQKWIKFWQNIKSENFDIVFDFSLNSTFSALTFLSGIPQRIGFNYRNRGFLLTMAIPFKRYEERHVIDYYLDLLVLASVPVVERRMSLGLPPKARQWAQDWLKQEKIEGKILVAVIPGGGASWGAQAQNKRWPAVKYVDLVDKIIAKFDATIILMGDTKEEDLCRQVARQSKFPLYSAVGQTSVLEMAALLEQCRMAIVNDGGPLHMAVAVGTKTVSIFGPVDAKVYGPFPLEGHCVVTQNLPCQPCYRQFRMADCTHMSCLLNLSVEEVYRKVESIL